MWQLEASGAFGPVNTANELEIDGATPPDSLPDASAVVIRFGGFADGRGFSTARRLRALGYAGRLIAAGPLAPDQARHAVQSGFDAVRVEDAAVDRHGIGAWAEALRHTTPALYIADPTSRGAEQSLWHVRHAASQ